MESQLDKKYIFNPNYVMFNDTNRIIFMNSDKGDDEFHHFTHPIFAMYLSFFTGEKTLGELLPILSETFNTSQEDTYKFIEQFIENPNPIYINYDNQVYYFRNNILIENRESQLREDMKAEEYLMMPPYDYNTRRFSFPISVLFVVNTKCVTDCRYCYADRYTQYKPMETEKIIDLIKQCKEIGVRSFDISGGELFNQKDWDLILKALYANGYDPTISTKYPISKQMIDRAWEVGVRSLQISLDSLSPEICRRNLNVSETYAQKIKESIEYMDSKGFEIILKSTVTNETCTLNNVKEIIDFANTLKNIKRYTYTPVGYSHFKTIEEFNGFKPSKEQVDETLGYLDQCAKMVKFDIKKDTSTLDGKEKYKNNKVFCNRNLCTGNVNAVVVLPDGKITICEELYWDERFILGDLTHNSLIDIWKSERAFNLWKLEREAFPEDSKCKSCNEFEKCRHGLGVCWKEVIAAYGTENWLYPDLKCPQASKPKRAVFFDNSFL